MKCSLSTGFSIGEKPNLMDSCGWNSMRTLDCKLPEGCSPNRRDAKLEKLVSDRECWVLATRHHTTATAAMHIGDGISRMRLQTAFQLPRFLSARKLSSTAFLQTSWFRRRGAEFCSLTLSTPRSRPSVESLKR